MGIFPSKPSNVLSNPPRRSSGSTWALVTGATTGIGRDIAHELCARGFNVVIHGRSSERLDNLAATLRGDHGIEVKTLVLDASTAFQDPQSARATAQKVLAELDGLNLRVLINNVGTGHDPTGFKPFESTSAAEISALLHINVGFMTNLTHALLPVLRKSAAAGVAPAPPSIIVNAGSLADMGLPYVSVYSGTKAYIRAFSRALDTELAAEGAAGAVRVVAAVIGDTDSDGHRVGTNLATPGSRAMARMVLDAAGRSDGGSVVPYWAHAAQEWLCALQPYWLLRMGVVLHFKQLMAENAKKRS